LSRAALLLPVWLAACAAFAPRPAVTVADGRYAMGTVFEVTLVTRDEARARKTLAEIFARVERLEALVSTWDPNSQVSRLNRAAGQGPVPVSARVARLLRLGVDYAGTTRGSFDVTVGPLVDLWTEAASRGSLPTAQEIASARARVGSEHLRVQGEDRAELLRAGMRIDLGGIAKGFALDLVRPLLARRDIQGALLSFGQSSTLALGRPQEGPGWRLLARGPGERFLGVLELEDQALSVSGSLGQWVEIGGRRFGHVIDPRTGLAATQRREALVLAPEAALAEALSKALLVLGEREGIALVAAQPGCEALLVDADGGVWHTPRWQEASRFEPVD
jgi:thiamine biosynthesis lipoprotein